jgi:hypothetical protein
VYLNDEPSGDFGFTGAGDWTVSAQPGAPEVEPQDESQQDPAGEDVSSGLLMSFLTDFRTAHYEEVRRQRMEELEKTRKGRAHRPVPRPQDDAEDYGQDAYPDTENAPQGEWQQAEWIPPSEWPPPATGNAPHAQPEGYPPADGAYPASEPGYPVAACKPEDPAGNKRFPLGLPSFKNLGQSPATA